MNNGKRLYTTSKSNSSARHNGKLKDLGKSSSSRNKSFEFHPVETDTSGIFIPIVKQGDNARLLPRYTAVLGRVSDDGVGMEDLDQLQQDLEKLLSTCAVRHRILKSEHESFDHVEDKKDKKVKPHDKTPLKRKRQDEKSKYKDTKNGTKVVKTKSHSLPINNFINDLPVKHEVPKVSLPKNDTSDKFWLSIEPYCVDVTKDDVAFLDELIQECSQEVDLKVPEVGDHYAVEWTEETLAQEKCLGNVSKQKIKCSLSNEIKKNGLNTMVDTFSSPLTQRLLAALIEEKVITKFPTVTDKLKPSDLGVMKSTNGPRAGVCMDRRLRKELVEQGILDIEDLPKSIPQDDDVLLEIKKCQQELQAVNEHNVAELNKLRTIIAKDQRRQEVKEALDKVDKQVLEIYNKIIMAKQKQTTSGDDKVILPKPNLREYEAEASNIIKQQIILHRELTELTDFSLLY